jgi:hypothetical protein
VRIVAMLKPTGRRFAMTKTAFKQTPLLTRNRSHNRPRPSNSLPRVGSIDCAFPR